MSYRERMMNVDMSIFNAGLVIPPEIVADIRRECVGIAGEADREIAALKARIAELEAERPEVRPLALCEQEHVLLAPGHLYTFEIFSDCEDCQRLAAQLDAPPANLPVGDMPNKETDR